MKAKFMLRGEERAMWVTLEERDGFKAAPPLKVIWTSHVSGDVLALRLQAVDDGFAYYQIA